MKIHEQKVFVNDAGMAIHAHFPTYTPARGATQLGCFDAYPLFFAMVTHAIGANGQVQQDQFRIDIPAETIDQAFELLPSLIPDAQKRRIEELNAQLAAQIAAQRSQLVLPNGQALPPAGNPKSRFK